MASAKRRSGRRPSTESIREEGARSRDERRREAKVSCEEDGLGVEEVGTVSCEDVVGSGEGETIVGTLF